MTLFSLSFVYNGDNTFDAYALRQVAGSITLDISPGESKSFEWGIASDDQNNITQIKLHAEGNGAEFVSFGITNKLDMAPSETRLIPVTISIPVDYPGGITLSPRLYATEFGDANSSTVMNIQMIKIPTIIISLNDDTTLHVNWEELHLEELRQQQALDTSITTPDESPIILKQDNDVGFTIIADTNTIEPENTLNESPITTTTIEPENTLNELPICGTGTIENKQGICVPAKTSTKLSSKGSGGCLIATATYGSEMAPQVQLLREIRDNSLLQTESGISFMSTFNEFYYSFSPIVADLERENPLFKETVKIVITPMLSSLSILNYVDMDSEVKVLGYGTSLILLNIGMYGIAPALIIYKIRKQV